jgi:SHAQKYF class myb-like DNA-binding protein
MSAFAGISEAFAWKKLSMHHMKDDRRRPHASILGRSHDSDASENTTNSDSTTTAWSGTMTTPLSEVMTTAGNKTPLNTTSVPNNSTIAGRWTEREHAAFLHGLSIWGREWTRYHALIPTRTAAQIRSHAQKYFLSNKYGTTCPDTKVAPLSVHRTRISETVPKSQLPTPQSVYNSEVLSVVRSRKQPSTMPQHSRDVKRLKPTPFTSRLDTIRSIVVPKSTMKNEPCWNTMKNHRSSDSSSTIPYKATILQLKEQYLALLQERMTTSLETGVHSIPHRISPPLRREPPITTSDTAHSSNVMLHAHRSKKKNHEDGIFHDRTRIRVTNNNTFRQPRSPQSYAFADAYTVRNNTTTSNNNHIAPPPPPPFTPYNDMDELMALQALGLIRRQKTSGSPSHSKLDTFAPTTAPTSCDRFDHYGHIQNSIRNPG